LKHSLSKLRDLDEVDSTGLGKDDFQFACGPAQQREAGAHNLPVVFRVPCGGQFTNSSQRSLEA
jgi:hypothetical protein